MQTVFENSLMQHHVALPPDAMGKITYVAPAGQYSLKVRLFAMGYRLWFMMDSPSNISQGENQVQALYIVVSFAGHCP